MINCKISAKKWIIFEHDRKYATRTAIEEEKLRYFISKILFWDYFNISESVCKSYPVEEKYRLLNKYYSEPYYVSGNFFILFLSGILLSGILFLCLAILCVKFSCVW